MLRLADHLTLVVADWASAIYGPVSPAERRATPAVGFDTVDLKTADALIEEFSTTPTTS